MAQMRRTRVLLAFCGCSFAIWMSILVPAAGSGSIPVHVARTPLPCVFCSTVFQKEREQAFSTHRHMSRGCMSVGREILGMCGLMGESALPL